MGKARDSIGFYRRGRTWYTNDPVTKRDVSTRCTDLAAAKLWRQGRERFAANPALAIAENATLGDECRMMVDALAALGRDPDYYEHKLGQWVRILGNDLALSEMGPVAFDRFMAERRLDGVSNHTISKELKCMITTLRFAKRAGRYSGDIENLRPLGFTADYVPRTRALSIAEVGALLAVLEPEAQAFVVFCVALGLRRGEVLKLDKGDVREDAVRVRGTKTKGADRELPILAPFRPLVALAAKRLPIKTWGRTGYYTRSLALSCERAGIAPCTPNDLRRTHATLLRSAKVDADTARQLLGHSRGSQTLEVTYDKPTPGELAARAGELPGLAAGIESIARSLQSATKPRENGSSERPWGPNQLAQARDSGNLGRSKAAESAQEDPGEVAESLQAAIRESAARADAAGVRMAPSFLAKSRRWFLREAS